MVVMNGACIYVINRYIIAACVFFASKTSPFSISEKLKPLIDSLSQAMDFHGMF
jgi:hypothetical protein